MNPLQIKRELIRLAHMRLTPQQYAEKLKALIKQIKTVKKAATPAQTPTVSAEQPASTTASSETEEADEENKGLLGTIGAGLSSIFSNNGRNKAEEDK